MTQPAVLITSVTDEQGREYGFAENELGEFDKVEDLDVLFGLVEKAGFQPIFAGQGRDLATALIEHSPCLVWNLNQGLYGRAREAEAPALCEMLGFELLGSGSWTAMLTQDKLAATLLVEKADIAGLAVPQTIAINEPEHLSRIDTLSAETRWFIKPRFEGSSRGIDNQAMQANGKALKVRAGEVLDRWGPVLIQDFIDGIDISANALTDDLGTLTPLAPIVIDTETGFDCIDMKADYTNLRRRQLPLSELHPEHVPAIKRIISDLSRLFHARDYFRTDLRLDPRTGRIIFLEANLTPTFADHDEFILGAKLNGQSLDDVVKCILGAGDRRLQARKKKSTKNPPTEHRRIQNAH